MTDRGWNDTYGDIGLQQGAQLTRLPLVILDPWTDEDGRPQPFKPYSPEKLQELAENIRANGVIEPIRVRPRNGRFQILAGHNRVTAAGMAELTTIPAIVEDVDDAQAAMMLVDSNLQHREKLLPSELAFAYALRMKEEKKLRKAGRPSKENSCKLCTNLRSDEASAEAMKVSARTIQNFIRLTELIPSLLDKVDAGTLGMTVGVDLSYLSKEAQAMLVRLIEQHGIKKLKGSQAAELKAAGPEPSEETILQVLGIFGEEKESFPSLTIKPDFSDYSPSLVKRLKKSKDYMEGLEIAIRQFTDKYIQDNKKL